MAELADLIPITQEKIGALISKPKMTEKLLSKSPFRFLHDIVSAITRETGFADGLYEGAELDGKGIKGRDAKIAYLEKIVICVGICLGEPVDIRLSKVVAGSEPEKTNVFLQQLADVATRSLGDFDFDNAVSLTLNGAEPGSVDPPVRGSGGGSSSSKIADDESDDGKGKDDDEMEESIPENKSNNNSKIDDDMDSDREVDNMISSSKHNDSDADAFSNLPRINSTIRDALRDCDGSHGKTQQLLGDLIRKPKLSEKLLKKPPFRFLQDVILGIFRETGFGDGLFEGDELNSGVKRNKEQKREWMDKVIRLVGIHLRQEVDIQLSKLLAGLEADKTNKFLQYIGVIVNSIPDSSGSVPLALRGLGPADVEQGDSAGFTPPVSPTNEKEQEPEQDSDEDIADLNDNNKSDIRGDSDIEDEPKSTYEAPSYQEPAYQPKSLESNRPPQYDPIAESKKNNNEDSESDGKRSMRPKTARKRPPKFKENVQESKTHISKDVRKAPTGIMMEGEESDDDDDDEIDDLIDDNDLRFGADKHDRINDGEKGEVHSKLVQDIMDKEAEEKKEKEAKDSKVEIKQTKPTGGSGIRLGRLRKTKNSKVVSSGFSKEEIEKLRAGVQAVCQSTNPLGKSVDYIHDDMATMNRELEKWKEDYRKKSELLDRQKRKTDELLQPLRIKLMELDEQLQDQTQKINTVQSNILRNESRISHLLRDTCSS